MNLFKTIMSSCVILGLNACSHGPTVQEFPETASPPDEIGHLNANLDTAMSDYQADVLSPDNFQDAVDARDEAKRDLDNKEDPKEILHSVAVGNAYLKRAKEVSEKANVEMGEVVAARRAALDAGSRNFYNQDLKDIDQDLSEVGDDLEDDDAESARENRGSLQARYLDLELKSIKQGNIGEARDKISQAKSDDADDLTPRTLAIAEKSYNDTDAFINANRHHPDVKTRSKATRDSTNHLEKILRDTKIGNKTAPEELALKLDSGQKQVAAKNTELTKKSTELELSQSRLSKEQRGAVVLGAANLKLEDEKKFQENYDRAQKEFSKDEAVVYKEKDTLVIRLKALAFPTAKATLKTPDFALLSKVEKVIKEFGESTVVVEGHTDSMGSKEANDKLSSARANAVKEYLVYSEAIDAEKITAVGRGYQAPVAENKTASGRAQNRRVDVLIKPARSESM